jgi:alanine racemase
LATRARKPSGASSLAIREADLRTSIRPTVAEVDLAALRRNAARIRATVGRTVAVYGVVKADAYGHGAVAVASVLEPLVDGLAVSLVEEGIELRDGGISKPILVLGAYYGGYHSEVLEQGLTPVIYDAGDFERFGKAPVRRRTRVQRSGSALSRGDRFPVHVKIDTGMNRLGLDLEAIPGLAEVAVRFPRMAIDGLCTHLASADLASPEATLRQLARFDLAIATARAHAVLPQVIHAANSAGMARFPQARFSAIRPGLALYGSMPSEFVARPDLEPVLSLRTRIMALHRVAAGGQVSYGGRWQATRDSAIATLPLGYADGYPRHCQGAEVLVRGQRAQVVGAVCMDMMMIDVTDIAGAAVGDAAVIIGCSGQECIRADDVARWSGTISYEILCGISKRVPRIYRGQGTA